MPELLCFDDIRVVLWIPPDTEDHVADAARVALDEPEFRVDFVNAIQQFFTTGPALNVLSVVVEI
jgi:hypothetical protein